MVYSKNYTKDIIHLKYLAVSEHDLLWGLTVNTVGYQHIPFHSVYPLPDHPAEYLFSTQRGRTLNEYQLLYIVRGKGSFTSENCKHQNIKEGHMFLLFPGEWHNYMPEKSTGWDEYWIGFKGINIDNRVTNGFFTRQKPIFNVGMNEEIVKLYQQAIQIAIEQKAGFQQMLAGIANHLLGLAYSLDKNLLFEDSQVINQINKAKIIMIENSLYDLKPEDIAKELNMSYSWFRKMFREYTGFAPAQYILELKMQKIKELLTNTNLEIKEISFKTGFENQEYFFTFFKKKTGMTPIQYRTFTQGKTDK